MVVANVSPPRPIRAAVMCTGNVPTGNEPA